MNPFLSRLHRELRLTRLTRRGATKLPHEVPEGLHKEYPRMERVLLPEPTSLELSLSEALRMRLSQQQPGGELPLSLHDISSLFGNALMRRGASSHRNYPSGGALYPIETYLVATLIEGVSPGVFHYHPTDHVLERLWGLPPQFELTRIVSKPSTLAPTALVVFTSVWERSAAKYGDFAYGLSLLEAGHMSENILLVGTALGLEMRPMAGFNDELLIQLLDLNEEREQSVHSVTLSKGGHASGSSSVIKSEE